ncbi:putative tail protein [Vibrio phage VP16C]|nr:putative tail protein [Vibrio phage VP16C]
MGISNAIDNSVRARVLGIKTEFRNFNTGRTFFLPQHVALLGQGNTAATYELTPFRATSAAQVGQRFGFGSPLHLAALQLLPDNNDGLRSIPLTIFPMGDNDAGVAAEGVLDLSGTASATATVRVRIGSQRSSLVTIPTGTTAEQAAALLVAGIQGNPFMPMTAAVDGTNANEVDVTAKWQGLSGNDLVVSIEGSIPGITVAITQPTGGAADPEVADTLALFGENVWYTQIVSCFNTANTDALDAFETFGEGRWDPILRRPLAVFTGTNETDPNTLAAIGDARRAQRTNLVTPVPGAQNLPCEIAAAWVARVARSANNDPASDFARLTLPGLTPGTDAQQWTHTQRDLLVKAGISTSIVRDGVAEISDTVTTYHPTGEVNPGYLFYKDTVKASNVLFNLDLIFNTREWDGAPLIPDDQPTTNARAKRPKDAVAVLSVLANNLGLDAIISDVPFTLENIRASINDQNPNRLDIIFPAKNSGNANIISADYFFGFFLGTQAAV